MKFKNKVEEVCIVLEKMKNVNNIVFTNMTEVSKKVNGDTNPKEVKYIVEELEKKGLLKTLKRSTRQTVIEIKENLLVNEIDIPEIKLSKQSKDLKTIVSITPKRLWEYIKSKAINDSLTIQSKDLCYLFDCKYDKLKLVLDALVRTSKIEYAFNLGTLNISLLESKENLSDVKDDVCNENIDANTIFDDIGNELQAFFDAHRALKEEVVALRKQLEIATISNKQLRQKLDVSELRCKQMVERNNRLYNDMVVLRTEMQ